MYKTKISPVGGFYDNLILSGTKMFPYYKNSHILFYDNLILSGTKIVPNVSAFHLKFYDNLILSGTKIAVIICYANA